MDHGLGMATHAPKTPGQKMIGQLEMPNLGTVLGENRGLGAKLTPESSSLSGRWKNWSRKLF